MVSRVATTSISWTEKFWKVVDIIKQIHAKEGSVAAANIAYKHLLPLGHIYGRITTHANDSFHKGPQKLAESNDRKTVFLFGNDAVEATILESNTFDTLIELGLTKEMVTREVKQQKNSFWLILFQLPDDYTNTTASPELQKLIGLHPATWQGVLNLVRLCYPIVAPDMEQHFNVLQSTPFEEFEKEAGFKFIDTHHSGTTSGPPAYTYDYYCTLSPPRKAWQTRLFLYCELHLFQLYAGDGRTQSSGMSVRHKEYLSLDVSLEALKEHAVPCKAIKLTVAVPE